MISNINVLSVFGSSLDFERRARFFCFWTSLSDEDDELPELDELELEDELEVELEYFRFFIGIYKTYALRREAFFFLVLRSPSDGEDSD